MIAVSKFGYEKNNRFADGIVYRHIIRPGP